jgi:hypothetical protein
MAYSSLRTAEELPQGWEVAWASSRTQEGQPTPMNMPDIVMNGRPFIAPDAVTGSVSCQRLSSLVRLGVGDAGISRNLNPGSTGSHADLNPFSASQGTRTPRVGFANSKE